MSCFCRGKTRFTVSWVVSKCAETVQKNTNHNRWPLVVQEALFSKRCLTCPDRKRMTVPVICGNRSKCKTQTSCGLTDFVPSINNRGLDHLKWTAVLFWILILFLMSFWAFDPIVFISFCRFPPPRSLDTLQVPGRGYGVSATSCTSLLQERYPVDH